MEYYFDARLATYANIEIVRAAKLAPISSSERYSPRLIPQASRTIPSSGLLMNIRRLPSSTFQRSMLISATRCTLTYVVFPFLLPFLHFLRGGAPVMGVIIGSVALVCDTFTIRRFFAIDHKWRWYFSSIAFGIMCLLSVLLVQDLSTIISRLA